MSPGNPVEPATSPRVLRVQVWADLVCPWCYLGKHRLEQAVHEFEHPAAVEVRYRSFELDPAGASPAGRPVLDVLGQRHGGGPAQARSMLQPVVEAAAADGIALDIESTRTASSFDAHRLVQLALASGGPAEQSAVLERLFCACHCEGRALDDVPTLQRLAAEAGLDERRVASVLAADDYAEQVREDETLAGRLGIRAVPHLMVGAVPGAVPDRVSPPPPPSPLPSLSPSPSPPGWVTVSGAATVTRLRDALRDAWADTGR